MADDPNEYVRVKDKGTGHEYSIRRKQVHEDAHEVIDKDALGRDGSPRPVKYRTELGTPLPGSKQAQKRTQSRAETSPAVPSESSGRLAGSQEDN